MLWLEGLQELLIVDMATLLLLLLRLVVVEGVSLGLGALVQFALSRFALLVLAELLLPL